MWSEASSTSHRLSEQKLQLWNFKLLKWLNGELEVEQHIDTSHSH